MLAEMRCYYLSLKHMAWKRIAYHVNKYDISHRRPGNEWCHIHKKKALAGPSKNGATQENEKKIKAIAMVFPLYSNVKIRKNT